MGIEHLPLAHLPPWAIFGATAQPAWVMALQETVRARVSQEIVSVATEEFDDEIELEIPVPGVWSVPIHCWSSLPLVLPLPLRVFVFVPLSLNGTTLLLLSFPVPPSPGRVLPHWYHHSHLQTLIVLIVIQREQVLAETLVESLASETL